jgi:hypothetical protein
MMNQPKSLRSSLKGNLPASGLLNTESIRELGIFMAGYKQAVLNYNPEVFLTFDGDSYDHATFALTASPAVLIDESGNGNNALFHEDQPTYRGYMMARTSLVALEPVGQNALSLGYNGGYPAMLGTWWPKTYLEIPNTSSFAFPNNGSFSVMLMYQKMGNEQAFRTFWQTYYAPGQYQYNNLYRTIITKGSYFNLFVENEWGSGSNILKCIGPDGVVLAVNMQNSGADHGDIKHIAYTWNVEVNLPTSKWKSTSSLYMNGILMSQSIKTYLDVYPNTNTAESFFIGGTPVAPDRDYNDRTTEDTRFDQLAVFNTVLSPYDVQFFYKKTLSYQNMLLARQPLWIVPFNDPEVPSNYGITALIGASGTAQGGLTPSSTIQRQQPGPSNVPGSSATRFQNGAQAYFNPGYYNAPVFDPNADYTIDFWFTCSSGTRGVLFSQYNGDYAYNGMLLQTNWANNILTPGALQFNVDDTHFVSSTPGKIYNDGMYHYVCMIRRGHTIELWVDGILNNSTTIPSTSTAMYPNTVSMFNMAPGSLSTSGTAWMLSACASALAPPEIWGRYNYALIYKIQGVVTLEGLPTAALIRLYNHTTGEQMQTTTSSSVDGSYTFHPPVNMTYDIMILNSTDTTVRYRAYGPLIPSTFDDFATH